MVRDFARIIGVEARRQTLELTGALPDAVVACVGGGSNAIGVFHAFLPDESVKLYGFEAGGSGVSTGLHAASITGGSVGVLHGTRTFLLQDEYGQTKDSHSISAGLDYPAVGPEHAWLHATGRAVYEPVDDARPWTPSASCARPRASSRPSSPRMPWPARCGSRRSLLRNSGASR